MPDSSVVFVPTISHTGTWFLIDTLFAHPSVGSIVDLPSFFLKPAADGRGTYPYSFDGVSEFNPYCGNLLHVHMYMVEDWASGKEQLLSGDWLPGPYYTSVCHPGMIELLARCCATVVPIRDPVSVLMSTAAKKHYGPGCNAHVAREFRFVVETLATIPNVFFFPIDTHLGVDGRCELLQRLMAHCGLPVDDYPISQRAETWGRVNSVSRDHALRRAYRSENMDIVRQVDGFGDLVDMLPILRPFLESLGYRDLLWWE